MKAYIKVGIAVSGLLATVSLIVSFSIVLSLIQKVPVDNRQPSRRYHLAMYVPDTRNAYFSGIVSGAQKAAADHDAAISVHTIDAGAAGLRMAIWLGVDGVAVCPDVDDEAVKSSIEILHAKNIPLVILNHNIALEQPLPFIGTNYFDFGKKVGSLIGKGRDVETRIAVIYSEKNLAMYAERELVEMGIRAAAGKRDFSSVSGLKTDTNPRAAEQVVYQLVRGQSGLTTIVFTDLDDTLAGTQALIDLNLVGKIAIVGFGSNAEVIEYIKKGIILGTLVVNPEMIGYEAVYSLIELRTSGYTSNSVDTGIDLITQETLNQDDYFEKGRDK